MEENFANMEENFANMGREEHFTCMEHHSKSHVCACVFSVVRAFKILYGYNLSGQMKRAKNPDSKTHVKRGNPTSRTEIRRKLLYYLFLETPCRLNWRYSEFSDPTGRLDFAFCSCLIFPSTLCSKFCVSWLCNDFGVAHDPRH